MTHDQLWGSGLILGAIVLFAASTIAARRDRSRLPGALASEDRAGFDAGLQAQRTQGMGVLGVEEVEPDPVAPVYEGTVIDWLERSYKWPTVVEFLPEWPGDDG